MAQGSSKYRKDTRERWVLSFLICHMIFRNFIKNRERELPSNEVTRKAMGKGFGIKDF